MTATDREPTEEQRKILDDAAMAIIKIQRDAQAKLEALDDDFPIDDHGPLGSPCHFPECNCRRYKGSDVRCKTDLCGHPPGDHLFS